MSSTSLIDTDENGRISGHSKEAIELIQEFVCELEAIPDTCAEGFPFEMIKTLKADYLS